MGLLVITISNLIWFLYSITEGVKEGFFNHYKDTYRAKESYDFKNMFLIQRLLVLLSTGGIMLYTIGLIGIPFIIGQIFIFHFLHKFSYNCTIKKIEKTRTEANSKAKEPIILLGISIQILTYLFFM